MMMRTRTVGLATPRRSAHGRRGLALPEVLAAAAVVGVALCLLLVVGDRSRRLAGLSESVSNLRTLSAAHARYAQSNADRVASFSWTAGSGQPTQFSDLLVASSDVDAAAGQAVDIMRRLAGGTAQSMPRIANWLPHIAYTQLVLADDLGQTLPYGPTASPGDATLLGWRNGTIPLPDSGTSSYRWRFSSSYEMPTAFSSWDARSGTVNTLAQSSTHASYTVPAENGVLGRRLMTDVAFPSQKTLLYERVQRYFGPRDLFALFPEARVPHAMADGSVDVRRTGESNRGFQPNVPTSVQPTTVVYQPSAWEPAIPQGLSAAVPGQFRWTRSGLRGRDFDGPEVAWTP